MYANRNKRDIVPNPKMIRVAGRVPGRVPGRVGGCQPVRKLTEGKGHREGTGEGGWKMMSR
jgi:hypothetical protein